jgi:hypothetical protein
LEKCDKSATLVLMKRKNGPPYIRAGRVKASDRNHLLAWRERVGAIRRRFKGMADLEKNRW